MAGQTKTKKTHSADVDPFTKYASDMTLRLVPAQKKLIEVTKNHERSRMLISMDEAQLLGNLCKYMNARKTLDIGVYTGYSALTVALALPDDGKVVACDVSEDFVNIGKPIWKEAGIDHKVDLRIAPAAETLQSLLDGGEAGSFDFAFIDADKPNYDTYYEMSLKLLRTGGLIAIDNVWWSGRVLGQTDDSETASIKALNEKIRQDERVDVSMLAIADGVTLAWKR